MKTKSQGVAIGRPRTISARVREAIAAAGPAGLTPAELRERIPGLDHRQGKHSVDRLVDAGEIYRLGHYRQTKFFSPDVPMAEAQASHARHVEAMKAHAKALEVAAQKRWTAVQKAQRAEQKAALAGERSAKAAERALATKERERLRQERRNEAARAKTAAKRHREANALANRIRGTGTASSAYRGPVTITRHADFRMTVAPKPIERYGVDPRTLTGLSKLPFGNYAEPASTWAATLTDKRAA